MKYLNLFEGRLPRKKYIEDFYKFRCSDDPYDPEVVGWNDIETQNSRFNVFLKHIDKDDSILDFGCGVGDFYGYLKKNDKSIFNFLRDINTKHRYKGVDIQPKMIENAKKKYRGGDFSVCGNIRQIKGKFDWIVASGVFTVGQNHQNVLNYFKYGYDKCNKGIMANFLSTSDFYSGYDAEIVTYRPLEGTKLNYTYYNKRKLKEYLEKELGKKFNIISGYEGNDFSLILLK